MGGASAHRRGAHRARRGCTARPGGDQGDRPFAAARAVEGRVRRAARDERGRDRDDGAVDGRDSSAVRHVVTGPLLAIDGDSFAHRAYHALPKSINRNAVVGFTNMVVRLWEAERPRAVRVGWDSLESPTYTARGRSASHSRTTMFEADDRVAVDRLRQRMVCAMRE